ncbi:MAG: terminase family protein [Bacteroidota bacterium]|nr:terminase family protein [Bacteroidota bacterium]
MKLSKEKIEWLRQHPCKAAEILLSVKLTWYQRIFLRTAWFTPNVCLVASRGLGKTFCAAVLMLLQCLLYRKMTWAVVAGSYIQSLETFVKIKQIYYDSPLLQQETLGPPKESKDSAVLEFRNGSRIEAFPLISRRRGKRFVSAFIDEYREIDEELERTVLQPMLVVQVPGLMSHTCIASTATYMDNSFYTKVKSFEEQVAKGNRDYAVCKFNIYDAMTSPYMNEKVIADAKILMTDDEFKMEYEGTFISLQDGWISGKDVRACEFEFVVEIKGDPLGEYIIGLDNARVFDNTCITVWKILPGTGIRLVYLKSVNNMKFEEQGLLLRQIVKRFGNVVKIRMDDDQAGHGIADTLSLPAIDPDDGEQLPLIVGIDDYSVEGALRIIEGVKFRNKEIIWTYGLAMKKGIQDLTIQLPKDDYRIVLGENELAKLSDIEREKIELFREISDLKKELTSVGVNAATPGQVPSFYTKNRAKNKKDRFMSALLGSSAALEYYREISDVDTSQSSIYWG